MPLLKARVLLLCLIGVASAQAETIQEVLRQQKVRIPASAFEPGELDTKITSFAVSGTPGEFLLAYYEEDQSGTLRPPLRVLRYDVAAERLQRASLAEASAEFESGVMMNCLGSAMSIREMPGTVLIETHVNPSAGCVLVLSPKLELTAAVSGWVLGVMSGDTVIIQRSMVHFASVHPMRIAVFDLRRSVLAGVYPPSGDAYREAYSRALAGALDARRCAANNSSCDPYEFENALKGEMAVNSQAVVFGFVAEFSPDSFGDKARESVGTREIAYVFRKRAGRWEYRAIPAGEIEKRFGSANIEALVRDQPDAAWGAAVP